jgi:hypothetical protein
LRTSQYHQARKRYSSSVESIGETKYFEILKTYWVDWFERMNANTDKISTVQT